MPGIANYTFTSVEHLAAQANAGDADTLAFTGTTAPDTFNINLNAAGTAGDPVLQLLNAASALMLVLDNYLGFNTLNINGLDGADLFNVYTGPNVGRSIFIDGGLPTAQKKQTDLLNVYYVFPKPHIIQSFASQEHRTGLVDLLYATGARDLIQYVDIENVIISKQ